MLLRVVVVQGFTIATVKETELPPAANDCEDPPVYLLLAVTVGAFATVTEWLPTAASALE